MATATAIATVTEGLGLDKVLSKEQPGLSKLAPRANTNVQPTQLQSPSPPQSRSSSPISASSSSESLELKVPKAKSPSSSKHKPHYRPVHVRSTASILSRDPAARTEPPSYSGFRNLAMIALAVSNMRLLLEDYQNYGVFHTLNIMGLSAHDVRLTLALTASVPFHLFVALAIERIAVLTMPSKSTAHNHRSKHLWGLFAVLHALNAAAVLAISSYTVYSRMWSPAVGTLCECHAIVVCFKVASYALTNRDLRDAAIEGLETTDPLLSKLPYPSNLTLSNLVYFWWAPTLVYQPIYPRWPLHRRWGFIFSRLLEIMGSMVLIWFISTQYANPILESSLGHFEQFNVVKISECLLKLASVSMAIWLLGFFCLFQSFLNLLAELVRFGDREFYQDWWNAGSVGTYWRKWNRPVHNYFLRHFYIPMLKRGYSQRTASVIVFFLSAILHEVAVGVPTQSLIGVAFVGMGAQIPLVLATSPLEKMGETGATIGNCIFWLSFFLGQPMGVLLYYFAWNMKHQ